MREDDPQPNGTAAVELFDAPVLPELRGTVGRIVGYRELSELPFTHREAASLQVPLVFSFADPFRIGLRVDPTAADTHSSFASGLFAGPVIIEFLGCVVMPSDRLHASGRKALLPTADERTRRPHGRP